MKAKPPTPTAIARTLTPTSRGNLLEEMVTGRMIGGEAAGRLTRLALDRFAGERGILLGAESDGRGCWVVAAGCSLIAVGGVCKDFVAAGCCSLVVDEVGCKDVVAAGCCITVCSAACKEVATDWCSSEVAFVHSTFSPLSSLSSLSSLSPTFGCNLVSSGVSNRGRWVVAAGCSGVVVSSRGCWVVGID